MALPTRMLRMGGAALGHVSLSREWAAHGVVMNIHFTRPDMAPLALNRRETLLAYLQTPPTVPAPLTRAEFDALDAASQASFNRERVSYLSGGIVINTPSIAACKKALIRAFAANSARNSGHAGVMLTGDSTMGKTTTAKALLRWVVDEYSKAFPTWPEFDHIPVVYVEVPAAANAKTLMKVFCEFLGLTVLTRETADDLRTKVVHALRQANTQVIVVDELHNLAGRAAGVGEAADVLKGLSNDLTATFLYAGIDITSTLMSGPRGQQLAGRFTAVELSRYNWLNATDRKTWKGVVREFGKRCTLLDAEPGSLDDLVEYLYERTSGSLGALSRLLTGTAIDIITTGATETFTEDGFDGYTLDFTSELAYSRRSLPAAIATRTKPTRKTKTKLTPPNTDTVEAAKRDFMNGAAS